MVKYKVGDLVKVIGSKSMHKFKIGETIRVKEFDKDGDMICENDRDWWWVHPKDIEPIADDLDKSMCELAPANTSNPKGCEFCE